MEYNTLKNKLVLPEYGRNIQKMAELLLAIEDREKRNNSAADLIGIMSNMFPHLREIKDYKMKLWDHLAAMTDYKLDIDYPYPIIKTHDLPKPEKLPYNTNHIRFKHYGKTLQKLIEKTILIENEEEKQQLILMIANHMKKLYVTWNLKSVNDEIVFNDLSIMSGGKLVPTGDVKLAHVSANQKPANNNGGSNNQNKNRRPHNQQNKNKFQKRK